MPLNKPIGAITEEDLQTLVNEKEAESRFIDYKAVLVLDNEETKAEYRRDVTSFANAMGGDIIVGIRDNEKTKVPDEVCGFDLPNESEEQFKLRLQKILQSRIKPLLRGVAIRPLKLENNKWAAVIRIPSSFAKPHQVEAGTGRPFEFWVRIDGGKERMDIDELRDAVLFTESFTDQARAFRNRRVIEIKNNEYPVALNSGAKTILHLIPLDAFRSSHSYDLTKAEIGRYATNQREEWPRYFYGGFSFYNFDGVVNSNRNFSDEREIPGNFYVHFLRNGIVEAVENYRLRDQEQIIPIQNFQETTIESVQKFSALMHKIGIAAPIAIMVSLIGVRSFNIQLDPISHTNELYRSIDRDNLLIPEVLLTEAPADFSAIETILRPVFDVLWQSCNYRRCPNYEDDGTYNSSLTNEMVEKVFM